MLTTSRAGVQVCVLDNVHFHVDAPGSPDRYLAYHYYYYNYFYYYYYYYYYYYWGSRRRRSA